MVSINKKYSSKDCVNFVRKCCKEIAKRDSMKNCKNPREQLSIIFYSTNGGIIGISKRVDKNGKFYVMDVHDGNGNIDVEKMAVKESKLIFSKKDNKLKTPYY